ncbi:MAG: BsaWI family type II restriction enzyme, partial [Candidatus Heimdallarchaeota archaeon]
MKFNFEDIKRMFEEYKLKYGKDAVKFISQLFDDVKPLHKNEWEKNPTKKKDHEQSWRAFKGKNMQKLIMYIIKAEIEDMGMKVIDGDKIERAKNLPGELDRVKRNLIVDYGEFGYHLPDVDIIIYDPKSLNVICVVSSKVTLRERIAQPAYWKLKLKNSEVTQHIRMFFVTPDEDGILTQKKPALKGRAIVEMDMDGSYVLTDKNIEESDKVKLFEHFVNDLKELIENDEEIKNL